MNEQNKKLRDENKLLKQQSALQRTILDRVSPTIVNSDLTDRLALQSQINKTHNDKRDLYNVFGYELNPNISSYINRYLRQDIAKRVIEVYPKACWSDVPYVTDDVETQDETAFEVEYNNVCKSKKIKLFHNIRRLDTVAGFGHFGILFIGVRDGLDTALPLVKRLKPEDILFMAPYSEKNVTISQYVEDPTSERFGLPLMYKIEFGGYGGSDANSASNIMKRQILNVHYTRVIHVADGVLENDVFGTPRLQPVLNRLMDLEKIVGGGSEMFYLNARGGIHLNQETGTNLTNTDLLEQRMEEFSHNLTRYLRTKGFEVKTLNFDIADPKNYFDIIVSLISATTGIPKRILTGSEQAQLASSQDGSNWNKRVHERQIDYCENQILRPLIDWFILNGVLPQPVNDEYVVQWPDLDTITDAEKADTAVKVTQALRNYTDSQGAEMIMPPEQLFQDILGLEYREQDLPDTQDFDDLEEQKEDGEEPV